MHTKELTPMQAIKKTSNYIFEANKSVKTFPRFEK